MTLNVVANIFKSIIVAMNHWLYYLDWPRSTKRFVVQNAWYNIGCTFVQHDSLHFIIIVGGTSFFQINVAQVRVICFLFLKCYFSAAEFKPPCWSIFNSMHAKFYLCQFTFYLLLNVFSFHLWPSKNQLHSFTVAHTVVTSLIHSKVDYCLTLNFLTFMVLNLIVFNSAACVVSKTPKI